MARGDITVKVTELPFFARYVEVVEILAMNPPVRDGKCFYCEEPSHTYKHQEQCPVYLARDLLACLWFPLEQKHQEGAADSE